MMEIKINMMCNGEDGLHERYCWSGNKDYEFYFKIHIVNKTGIELRWIKEWENEKNDPKELWLSHVRMWHGEMSGLRSHHLVVWNYKVKDWLWLGKVLAALAHLSKLHCVIWTWFKGVDRFIIGGPSLAQNKDLRSWINLEF